MRKFFISTVLAILAACATAPATAQDTFTSLQDGHTGVYFDPTADGEGLQLNVVESSDVVFGTFYTFDESGGTEWFVFSSEITGGGVESTLYSAVGVAGEGGTLEPVGTVKLGITGTSTMALIMTFDAGEVRTYNLTALTPRLVPVEEGNCVTPDFSPLDPNCY